MKKIMIDIEATLNNKIIVTQHTPKGTGIIGFISPKIEPDKRSFNNIKEFTDWITKEIGQL